MLGRFGQLKSDQNGIEMWDGIRGTSKTQWLKSDQNGIEIYRFLQGEGADLQVLKSDQNGIEIGYLDILSYTDEESVEEC